MFQNSVFGVLTLRDPDPAAGWCCYTLLVQVALEV